MNGRYFPLAALLYLSALYPAAVAGEKAIHEDWFYRALGKVKCEEKPKTCAFLASPGSIDQVSYLMLDPATKKPLFRPELDGLSVIVGGRLERVANETRLLAYGLSLALPTPKSWAH